MDADHSMMDRGVPPKVLDRLSEGIYTRIRCSPVFESTNV